MFFFLEMLFFCFFFPKCVSQKANRGALFAFTWFPVRKVRIHCMYNRPCFVAITSIKPLQYLRLFFRDLMELVHVVRVVCSLQELAHGVCIHITKLPGIIYGDVRA